MGICDVELLAPMNHTNKRRTLRGYFCLSSQDLLQIYPVGTTPALIKNSRRVETQRLTESFTDMSISKIEMRDMTQVKPYNTDYKKTLLYRCCYRQRERSRHPACASGRNPSPSLGSHRRVPHTPSQATL